VKDRKNLLSFFRVLSYLIGPVIRIPGRFSDMWDGLGKKKQRFGKGLIKGS